MRRGRWRSADVCICVCYLSLIVWPWGENSRRIREPFKTPDTSCPSSLQSVYYHSFTQKMLYMCFWLLICSLYTQTLITSQHQLKEAEAEVSKLQNHLKELNREYRARLTRYIQDVTVCVQANRHIVTVFIVASWVAVFSNKLMLEESCNVL